MEEREFTGIPEKEHSVAGAVLVAGATAATVVATGLALKKWGLVKLIGGVAVPFVVKDSVEAFKQSRDRTYRYMQEHKNGRHYIKLK